MKQVTIKCNSLVAAKENFRLIESFNNNDLWIATDDGKEFFLVDKDGVTVSKKYSAITPLHNGVCLVAYDDTYYLADSRLKRVSDAYDGCVLRSSIFYDDDMFSYSLSNGKSYKIKISSEVNDQNSIDEARDDKDADIDKFLSQYGYFMDDEHDKRPVCDDYDTLKEMVIDLNSNEKNSVLLVGPSGSGKSSLVKALARNVSSATDEGIYSSLKGKRIFCLDMNSIIAGTTLRGQFEEKFNDFFKYIKEDGNIILFIDEIHTIVHNNDRDDTSQWLKPALANSEVTLIGATTNEEFERYMDDKAFKRRFNILTLDIPDNETVLKIAESKISFESDATNIKCGIPNEVLESLIVALNKKSYNYSLETTSANNPSFISAVISLAFAKAKIEKKEEVSVDDLVYAIEKQDLSYNDKRVLKDVVSGVFPIVVLEKDDEHCLINNDDKHNLFKSNDNENGESFKKCVYKLNEQLALLSSFIRSSSNVNATDGEESIQCSNCETDANNIICDDCSGVVRKRF